MPSLSFTRVVVCICSELVTRCLKLVLESATYLSFLLLPYSAVGSPYSVVELIVMAVLCDNMLIRVAVVN